MEQSAGQPHEAHTNTPCHGNVNASLYVWSQPPRPRQQDHEHGPDHRKDVRRMIALVRPCPLKLKNGPAGKKRWLDKLKEDTWQVNISPEDALNRSKW